MQNTDVPREEYFRVKAEAEELMQRLIQAHAKIEVLQSQGPTNPSSASAPATTQADLANTPKRVEEQQRLFLDTSPLLAGMRKTQAELTHRIQQLESQLKQEQVQVSWYRTLALKTLREVYRKSWKYKRELKDQIKQLRASDYFDGKWYLETYSDVASSRLDPVIHYLKFGALEGRNPSAHFDTLYYIQQNPDVAKAGLNPLLHFILYGINEGRRPAANQKLLPTSNATA
ncbi:MULTISPECIES: hypothetical protein [Nitrincola]|uniref:Uncharacterized protein n=1 Tax=Nitrincola nitratireducens TaxID=1229521 RepID=W9V3B9_9GAMM|nr:MULTISPECIES: hypothetical protein [Nitrincola]EXJ10652.1 hypothetical protein D791_02483 [Nitrincola nitratireducens]